MSTFSAGVKEMTNIRYIPTFGFSCKTKSTLPRESQGRAMLFLQGGDFDQNLPWFSIHTENLPLALFRTSSFVVTENPPLVRLTSPP